MLYCYNYVSATCYGDLASYSVLVVTSVKQVATDMLCHLG